MKRIFSVILAVLLVVSLTATVFAQPASKGGKKVSSIPPGIAKKLFSDSDEVKWAQRRLKN